MESGSKQIIISFTYHNFIIWTKIYIVGIYVCYYGDTSNTYWLITMYQILYKGLSHGLSHLLHTSNLQSRYYIFPYYIEEEVR